MSSIVVDSLRFEFPAGWRVTKYDDWAYYRNKFSKLCDNIKAVDLIAVDIDKTVWFIEAKDFRFYPRKKRQPIAEEIRDKVISTLSGILAAKYNANSHAESDIARRAVKAKKIRIVFHLEQRRTGSRLFPRAFDLADVQQKLRSLLRCIDAHPLVVESSAGRGLSWSVTALPRAS